MAESAPPIGLIITEPRITIDFQTRNATLAGAQIPYMNLIVTIANIKCEDFNTIWENIRGNIATNISTTTD